MKFLLRVENAGYEVSLEKLKLYRWLAGERAAEHGMVRVIDESGEDYLFEKSRFRDLQLGSEIVERLAPSA